MRMGTSLDVQQAAAAEAAKQVSRHSTISVRAPAVRERYATGVMR
jgi:hypothetical protein